MSYASLEDYKIQRQHREEKRKQYLNQFERLKHNLCPVSTHSAKPSPTAPNASSQPKSHPSSN